MTTVRFSLIDQNIPCRKSTIWLFGPFERTCDKNRLGFNGYFGESDKTGFELKMGHDANFG